MFSRTEETTSQESTTWCCCCGDAEDGVDLVGDHVSDQVDQQVLDQSPVLQVPGLLLAALPTALNTLGILQLIDQD